MAVKRKRRTKIFRIVFWVIAGWFIGHMTYTIADGLIDRGHTADYAVVLGNPINVDGTLSDRLQDRLECGIRLYFAQRVKGIIVSGAYGKQEFYEAERMRDYLRGRGVPESAIVVDNVGGSTHRTVDNVLKLRDRLHFNSLIIVSQYYHVTRCKMLFRRHGFKDVSSVGARHVQFSDLYYVPREFYTYYTELW